jgi:hypothetical protein
MGVHGDILHKRETPLGAFCHEQRPVRTAPDCKGALNDRPCRTAEDDPTSIQHSLQFLMGSSAECQCLE